MSLIYTYIIKLQVREGHLHIVLDAYSIINHKIAGKYVEFRRIIDMCVCVTINKLSKCNLLEGITAYRKKTEKEDFEADTIK